MLPSPACLHCMLVRCMHALPACCVAVGQGGGMRASNLACWDAAGLMSPLLLLQQRPEWQLLGCCSPCRPQSWAWCSAACCCSGGWSSAWNVKYTQPQLPCAANAGTGPTTVHEGRVGTFVAGLLHELQGKLPAAGRHNLSGWKEHTRIKRMKCRHKLCPMVPSSPRGL